MSHPILTQRALGGQVTSILHRMLDRKLSKTEQQQMKEIIQQYEQIKTTHEQIGVTLQKYNQGIQGLIIGRTEDLFPLCTDKGYQPYRKIAFQTGK